jgi:hypothetical protein
MVGHMTPKHSSSSSGWNGHGRSLRLATNLSARPLWCGRPWCFLQLPVAAHTPTWERPRRKGLFLIPAIFAELSRRTAIASAGEAFYVTPQSIAQSTTPTLICGLPRYVWRRDATGWITGAVVSAELSARVRRPEPFRGSTYNRKVIRLGSRRSTGLPSRPFLDLDLAQLGFAQCRSRNAGPV